EVGAVRQMLRRQGLRVSENNSAAETIMGMNSNMPSLMEPEEAKMSQIQRRARKGAHEAEIMASVLAALQTENKSRSLPQLQDAVEKAGNGFKDLISRPK
ncbi:MAG: hypothetical protein Q8P02_03380, partial [Candidatus Micrarchaeota archaeon]|nr:hypothetical protein [Candidatus Micrarchaeota archaeon]